jgi:Zn-dependent protease
MNPSIRLGRVFGIEIGLHYSWFIIALLIVLSLSAHFHFVNPQWSPALTWSLALITAVLFFASIVAHELSHAAVANARGLSVRSITLFALGGVANVEKESADAKSEFLMAIAGPIMSVVLGFIFLGISLFAGWRPQSGTPTVALWAGLVWLGKINIWLAVFNLIPGFPLDGGRILRSIIWGINRNYVRATTIATGIGQGVATAFIVFGLFRFFTGAGFGWLWLAFIGWFLAEAAAASRGSVQVSTALAEVHVADVMTPDCPAIDGNTNLLTFAEDHLLRTGRRCFLVVQDDRQVGLVSISELKQVPRRRWPFTTVAEITRPFDQIRTTTPATSVTEVLELMVRENINQLPVMLNGKLVGVISRNHIIQYIQTQAELKAA